MRLIDNGLALSLYVCPLLIARTFQVLGSVGEPINSEAWLWFYNLVGHGKCSIADTFWQTETGGHVITPLPGATPMKPGSAVRAHNYIHIFHLKKKKKKQLYNIIISQTFPFFGVLPELLDEDGHVIEGEGEGYLVFRRPWPGMMRTLYGNHQRFQNTYFDRFNGFYCTGDGKRAFQSNIMDNNRVHRVTLQEELDTLLRRIWHLCRVPPRFSRSDYTLPFSRSYGEGKDTSMYDVRLSNIVLLGVTCKVPRL